MSWFLPLMEIWGAVVVLMTGLAVVTRMHAGTVRPYLEVTTGVVTGHKFVSGDEYISGGYVPTLEFTIETGQLVSARAKGKPLSEPPEEGEEVSVLYRRDRPDKCYLGNLADHEREADVGVWATFLGTVLVSLLFLGPIILIFLLFG